MITYKERFNKILQLADYLAYLRWMSLPSSNIEKVQYFTDTKILQVEFTSGAVYQYQNVPEEKYQQMIINGALGASVGSYFYYSIRTSYNYKKIRG